MDDALRAALERDRIVDITTTGRKTGRPHRIEIWFHNLDGRLLITGSPGPRDWYANLLAQPRFTLHLKQTARADLPAMASPVRERARRRNVLSRILNIIDKADEIESYVDRSPLVEVKLLGPQQPNCL